MWNRRDWDEFFRMIKKRGGAQRPLRPVDRSHRNRLVPAEGYSLAELDDAGLSIEQAEYLGLPDLGKIAPGARACLVKLGEDLKLQGVWVDGESIAPATT